MTGPASSRGRLFSDFDSYKSQEWSRRRKLRLEQVRKQSNEIAKELREKAAHEEKIKTEKLQRIKEAQLKCWRIEKLEELEKKLMCALEEFGKGHKLAESEPDPNEILQIRNKINELKAQERGEIAYQEELRNKKLAKERELSPIRRRQMTRKLEDLRSALVRSVTIQKQLLDARDSNDMVSKTQENHESFKKRDGTPKKTETTDDTTNDNQSKEIIHKKSKKVKKKKIIQKQNYGAGSPKSKNSALKNYPRRNLETIWVNLNDIQSSSGVDSGSKYGSSQSGLSNKTHKKKTDKTIEFYDYPSRYYCKSFREFPHLVERIGPESGPNANELSKIEEESEIAENQKKVSADAVSKERGMEALKKEKINRDYQNMLSQLEELSKKEKIIKAQQRITPSVVHMTDERLMEKTKTKQKIMDSKFENIYYEAISEIPQVDTRPDFRNLYDQSAGGDYVEPDERLSTKLSFSPSNLKTNSPITPCISPVKTVYMEETQSSPKRANSKTKKKLLSDIDKALKEGRKLRQTISQNWERFDVESLGEASDVKTDENISPLESDEKRAESSSRGKSEGTERVVRSHDKESQTEDLGCREVGVQKEDFRCANSGRPGDESLPVSTSTSYKSPPSEIRSCRLRKFLECLESVSENEDIIESNPQLREKIRKFIFSLSRKINALKPEDREEFFKSSALEYYILKLLNMSREAVANLSVSSENTSTPNLTDLDFRNNKSPDEESQTSEYIVKVSPEKEKLVRESILKRATSLEREIMNWKELLEENLTNTNPILMSNKEPDCDKLFQKLLKSESLKNLELARPCKSDSKSSDYDQISKKCADRISRLSVMLQKVRKDKEKLLSSTSGTSSFTTNKEEKDQEVVPVVENSYPDSFSKHFSVLENFIDRYNLLGQKENCIVDSDDESVASSDSFPDIMEQLLKKNIITSPFKWSIGDKSFEISMSKEKSPKPPTIETAIEKFRREMSKIRPQSFTTDISFPFSPLSTNPRPSNSFTIDEKYLALLQSSDNDSENNKNSPGPSHLDNEELSSRSLFQNLEESSVDSIHRALTSLGLNWAKSVLRKSEETKGMSTSSGSEGEAPDDNDENYYYHHKKGNESKN